MQEMRAHTRTHTHLLSLAALQCLISHAVIVKPVQKELSTCSLLFLIRVNNHIPVSVISTRS